ncbi:hypothetical protein NB640_02800 [Oxalobacter vibrioformis]|uniref:Uncharacterized protein n=1 Tax=Oxalobacter vibrioformis TaxID=933080 RepID=A0A9E9P4Z4_9BURK|nr:hypothetical protein [Oxalobacter vibrioformis]WAW10606.1 hypothetical protein NB640_02800 [Oxalobacter vibrioformis]
MSLLANFDDVGVIVNGILDLSISEVARVRQINHLLRDYPAEIVIACLAERVFYQKKHVDAVDRVIARLQSENAK